MNLFTPKKAVLNYDDEVCREASKQEILRRWYHTACEVRKGMVSQNALLKLELLMIRLGITCKDRPPVVPALEKAELNGDKPAMAMELPDGRIVTGKTSDLLGASAAVLLNALKAIAGVAEDVHVIAPEAIDPIQHLKVEHLGHRNPRLHTNEVLIALSISAVTNPTAELAMEALASLRGSQVHSSVILSSVDEGMFKRLGMNVTFEPVYQSHTLYHK